MTHWKQPFQKWCTVESIYVHNPGEMKGGSVWHKGDSLNIPNLHLTKEQNIWVNSIFKCKVSRAYDLRTLISNILRLIMW